MGIEIPYSYTQKGKVEIRHYECGRCLGCPLSRECLIGKSRYRTITRDQYQELREKAIARMESEEGKKNYVRRMWLAEGTFGLIKTWMGVRQFLCRGLEKVRTEWLWTCAAFNLKKLVKSIMDIHKKIAAVTA